MAQSTVADRRSRAVGTGLVVGVILGAGWGTVLATFWEAGSVTTWTTTGAGVGAFIGLLAAAAAYREATR